MWKYLNFEVLQAYIGLKRTSDMNREANKCVGLNSFHISSDFKALLSFWKVNLPTWLDGIWSQKAPVCLLACRDWAGICFSCGHIRAAVVNVIRSLYKWIWHESFTRPCSSSRVYVARRDLENVGGTHLLISFSSFLFCVGLLHAALVTAKSLHFI